MNKALGGIFFASAGILLAVTKTPDIFTVIAVIGCAAAAAFSATKYSVWPAVGGTVLIAGSLALQTALAYRCMDCMKADLLILAGVLYQAINDSSGNKRVFRGVAGVVAVMLMANALLHYPVFAGKPLEAAQAGRIGQYIKVAAGGEEITLDTSVKPVLMFSSSCGACKEVIGKLAGIDPGGKGWTAVQVGDSPEELKELPGNKGYRGAIYRYSGWNGVVPALVVTRRGNTEVVYGQEEILNAVGGDKG